MGSEMCIRYSLGVLRQAGLVRDRHEGRQTHYSAQLGALKQAGLVRDRHEGRQTHYSAQPGALNPLVDWTSQMAGFWEARFDDLENLLARMDQ